MTVTALKRGTHSSGVRPLFWQGLLASAMITVASWGIGWFPRNQLSPLARSGFFIEFRTELSGVVACIIMMALGLAWLTRSWILLRPWVNDQDALEPKQLRNLIAGWSLPLLFSFPILSRDVYSYLAQGRMLHAGRSPYSEGISALPGWFAAGPDGLWAQSPSPYGPLFLVLSRVCFFVSNGVPEIGVGLLRIIAVLGMIGCYYFAVKLAKMLGYNPNWVIWAIVANPLFLLTTIGGVHNDALMMAGVFWAFAFAFDRRPIRATMVLALAVAIKPIVLLTLPFLGLAMLGGAAGPRQRFVLWIKLACYCLVWLTIIGAVTNLWFGWLPAMFSAGGAAFPYAPVGLLGWAASLLVGLFGGPAALVQSAIYTAFQVLSLVIVGKLALSKEVTRPLRLSAWALSAVVLLAPIIQPWYILWLIALFALTDRITWFSEKLMVFFSTIILVIVFVDQISIEQWHSGWALRIFAAVAVVLMLLAMIRCDRNVRSVLRGDFPSPSVE